jgi:RNA polymerase sigma-70 factor (ECF subfamily)
MQGEQRGALVREAIELLEPNRRLTLLLREVDEMSYEEIAETTGVAVGSVRSRLARARGDLRRLLEGKL